MHPYIGSGPYCYANSLAMVLGSAAPEPSTIEVLTGSPFGITLIAGQLPLFDPYGWDPDRGLDDAIALLGWACQRRGTENAEEALAMLRDAVKAGLVLVGPMEMGLLRHQPGMTGPIESDHFVVVFEADDTLIRFHDPHGHPYATLPTRDFLAAWRADTIAYASTSYTMRHGFRRVRDVTAEAALRAALPGAVAWLRGHDDLPMPPGTIGGAAAAHRIADLVAGGLDARLHAHLVYFAIRVGARGGAFVTSPTSRQVGTGLADLVSLSTITAAEVTEARLVFEMGIVPLIVAGATGEDIAELRELTKRHAQLVRAGTYTMENSADFHTRLAGCTHNAAIEMLVHTDDLACSVDLPPLAVPADAVTLATTTLLGLARYRHGDLAVLRALTRQERQGSDILRGL